MDENESPTPQTVARLFMEVIPAMWHSMSAFVRYGGDSAQQATFPQIRAMTALRHGVASLNDLARLHEVSPATTSRMVSTLVERGWVARGVDENDRRQVCLTLTGEGRQALDDIGRRSLDYLAGQLAVLSAIEREELERSLKALARVGAAGSEKRALK